MSDLNMLSQLLMPLGTQFYSHFLCSQCVGRNVYVYKDMLLYLFNVKTFYITFLIGAVPSF